MDSVSVVLYFNGNEVSALLKSFGYFNCSFININVRGEGEWDITIQSQAILYSGESLMLRQPPLRWLVYTRTEMEVFEKSSYFTFSQASKAAQSNCISIINRPDTL
mgnify:FL=1